MFSKTGRLPKVIVTHTGPSPVIRATTCFIHHFPLRQVFLCWAVALLTTIHMQPFYSQLSTSQGNLFEYVAANFMHNTGCSKGKSMISFDEYQNNDANLKLFSQSGTLFYQVHQDICHTST
jgi:hypothetical protein